MQIEEVELDDKRLKLLVELQLEHAHAHTPQDSGHAVEATKITAQEIRYFIASDGTEPIGCIGLAALSGEEAEIKTMHVVEARRGEGVADALLDFLLGEARTSGIRELKLETGRSEGFAASRRFYARRGFQPCPRYGRYSNDPFSFCMATSI